MNTTPWTCWSGAARPFHPFGRGLFMLLSALLLALPVPSPAAPGDLDPSFDGDGKVLTDSRGFEAADALVVQPDGKLVAAGGFFRGRASGVALARYNPDGSLDGSFGGDGRVLTSLGGTNITFTFVNALVLQPDGKLVALGVGVVDAFSDVADLILARYHPDGSLDASFGAGGVVRTDFGGGDSADTLVLQRDGKLVAAGRRRSGPIGNQVQDLILARYHSDGSLDASFGAGGFVVESNNGANALLLQPDGKLVAAGSSRLFRFNPDGSLESSFSGDAPVVVFGFSLNALALQADGKLVAAGGNLLSSLLLTRFNPDGSLDTSFGTGGLVMTDFGNLIARGLVLQADGKLVAGGAFLPGFSNSGFLVARFHTDGRLDASFGSGGAVRTGFGRSCCVLTASSSVLNALALQADGRLVAAGESNASGDGDFALARYVTTDEPLAVPPTCGGRPATILGTSRKDTIRGTFGPDVILGGRGNDTIRGLEGKDTICGGPGRDTLIGNDGKDRLLGEGGDDKLFGDNGSDSLDGGSGRDACRTGERARRCEGEPASSKPTSGERPKDPPKPPCPPISNFPCS